MWLPKSACDAIANVFSLTFSQTNKLYLINDTAHEKNLKNNPSVSIRIADTPTASESVTIHFPYSAFAHPYYDTYDPSYNNKTYFPIRLASDLTQYTLGRVFLQEAVLTVDHERKNFSISQVVNLKGVNPQIINIQSPSASNRNGSDVPTPVPVPSGGGGGISPGAIGGIVVALILLIAGILGLLIWRHRRRNRGGVYGTTQSTNPDTPGPDSGSGPGPMNVPLSLNSTNQKSRAIEIGSLAGHQRPYHKTVLSNTSNGSTTLDVSSDRDRAGSPAPAYAYPNTKTPPAELAEVTILPELPSHRRSSASFFNSPSLLATPPPIHSPVSELGPSSVGTMEPRYFPEELDQTFTPRSAEIMPLTLTRGASITDVRLTDRSPNIGLGRGSGSNNPTGAQGSTGDGMRATSGPMVLEYEGLGLSLPHSSSPSQS